MLKHVHNPNTYTDTESQKEQKKYAKRSHGAVSPSQQQYQQQPHAHQFVLQAFKSFLSLRGFARSVKLLSSEKTTKMNERFGSFRFDFRCLPNRTIDQFDQSCFIKRSRENFLLLLLALVDFVFSNTCCCEYECGCRLPV